MSPIRVALVEDDRRYLDDVLTLLQGCAEIAVVGAYTTGRSAIAGIVETTPAVALTDLELPDIPGVDVIAELRTRGCQTECVVLSDYGDNEHLFAALKAGAVGYIVKSELSRSELVQRIREVVNGGAPMSLGIARRILQEFRKPAKAVPDSRLQALSAREVEVLQCQAEGLTARKIAQKLFISYETVRSHQKAIYKKLHVHSLAEAVTVLRGLKRD